MTEKITFDMSTIQSNAGITMNAEAFIPLTAIQSAATFFGFFDKESKKYIHKWTGVNVCSSISCPSLLHHFYLYRFFTWLGFSQQSYHNGLRGYGSI